MKKFSKKEFKEMFKDRIETTYGTTIEDSTDFQKYVSVSSIVRDQIYRNWAKTNRRYDETNQKEVYYISIEFLSGRALGDNLMNMGITEIVRDALKDLGINLEEIEEVERDMALGNGGLGRLGSCFVESMASMGYPGHGYTLRYDNGLFKQKIIDGQQVELLDSWLNTGEVWLVRRVDKKLKVRFDGEVVTRIEGEKIRYELINYDEILSIPYDTPVVGYKNGVVNRLRMFNSELEERDVDIMDQEEMLKYINCKRDAEGITKILYPENNGKESTILRLKQEYFLSSSAIQSIVNRQRRMKNPLKELHKYVAIHLNDTHPVLSIPELLRILIDEEGFDWDEAWDITRKTISFTNHTILPEALECIDKEKLKKMLPRVYMIIEEIDRRFNLEIDKRFPGDKAKKDYMCIIGETCVRMANLAIYASHSTNGVAKLHTKILTEDIFHDFYMMFPERFNNKTNGVTHRVWLMKSNNDLSKLITEVIGNRWIDNPENLKEIERFKDDSSFKQKIDDVKRLDKMKLASYIKSTNGIAVDTNSIFDVQIKRFHEYKRQLLNILNIIDMYFKIKENPNIDLHPRTFIFGGKAAPGYYMAKRIISLIVSVASIVNSDKDLRDLIKVVMIEDYKVSLAENIFPASDLSEQISTASKEASGTGNMKFMMNGALTIGTMDGANIEILNRVGEKNFFKFGLSPEQVIDFERHGGYCSIDMYNKSPKIKRLVESLTDGTFPQYGEGYESIRDSLMERNDRYFVLKDLEDYQAAQWDVDKAFRNKSDWNRRSIVNIANSGYFSSDYTVDAYAKKIWDIRRDIK